MLSRDELEVLNARFETASTGEVLRWAWERYGTRAAIGTSFQGAGLVAIHLAREQGCAFPVFTLDTGLWFPETAALKRRLEEFFGLEIEALTPDLSVAQQAAAHGPDLWTHDPDLCCSLRKVVPLRAKLNELDVWLTGLRRQQGATRATVSVLEHYRLNDASGREVLKLNPLARWKRDEIWNYLRRHRIPYNPLHDRGYRSIGCWPCTRPTATGDDERAGRWTGFDKVECGIHTFMARKE
jgi:phosphoadenosine phosphosulfate reductase